MENSRKEQILSYLNTLSRSFSEAADYTPSILGGLHSEWNAELDEVSTSISKSDVYAPVVGGFSTGKSTALNSLIGRDILPEKVTPETAIPTELRFSEREFISALNLNGEWSEFGINELSKLSEHADQYQLVKVFVNAQVLKNIEPLVLVDMPGFDSGLDQHNKAILRYITTGALYLYMVNAKAGTVSRQDVQRIEEILDLGRSVKVFLTMTDLSSPEELTETHKYVSEHMSFVTGDCIVGQVNKDDVNAIIQTLEQADIATLFDGLVLGQARNLYFDANSHLNTAIHALEHSESDVKDRLAEAEKSLARVEEERANLLSEVENGKLTDKADQVVNKLEQKLNSSIDELATLVKSGESALNQSVSNIVRSTLSIEIQQVVRRITSDVAYHFTGDISLGSLSVGKAETWVTDMISVIENQAMDALTGLNDKTSKPDVNSKLSNGVLGGLSMAALAIPNPVLKVVFAILPGIIGTFFNSFREQNEAGRYREVITTQVIPRVIAEVRPQVQSSLHSIEIEIIKTVSDQITSKVEAQREVFKEVSESSETEILELRSKIDALKAIRKAMNESAEGVIA